MTLVEDRAHLVTAANDAARRAMIESQLRVSGVNDLTLLAAFAAIAREDHVPEAARPVAYMDRAVPLGDGSVLAPALTHGQMLTAAEPTLSDNVLVIGKPGAYLAALATRLTAHVTVAAPDGDWSGDAPYSLVLIDGAIEVAPAGLAPVLAEQGRVVTGLIERGVARLAIGRRLGGELLFTKLAEADFAQLPEFAAKKRWSF
ncbi:protein-L-isoaspartate O-methyltransferase family protein [Novosphingobium sp.]|uniref:protein-L-isoaspartate O-methyltransferase family protein n=1 Tax=Novosphingobium sp. TaxID=1874826 RepID=UPI003D10D9D1